MNGLAYHLDPARGRNGLEARTQELPEPGPHQVLVKVLAASLNRRDLMLMDGTYPLPATPGIVPLSDGVGEVIALGDKVTRAALGDRVTATYFVHWVDGPQRLAHAAEQYGANHNGMLATYALLEEDSVVHVPEHLTDAEAATLTCAGLVAWAALTTPVPVQPGQTVLTVGSGTVALFAVQHAGMLGARVISVTSTQEKAERFRKLGAEEVIVRAETPDWEQEVAQLTGGDGADHILDTVGMPTLPKSVASGAYNAQLTMIGAMPGPALTEGDGNPFGNSYLSIRRIAVGSRTHFEAMNRAITEHRLRPVIDRTFPFEQAIEAYRYFSEEDPFGKVVVTMS
ncbi:NAD(P)-dependent alcohol dehydrogenase [Nocardia sp. XZ_19_385]|uniref:zinc-dependent alcohol dehydrogenase family protein n=1 Tax=Nocardia sp. XZ_19_385 TaxID=2769488 RepID=UPI00188DD6B8|nr:NAD(P)-dependent alcohol dehydrogenase [Nocardia sp. XZ_19_385]